ncbi:peptidoglycan editing factor PgeF [Litorilituus sediminis]|uniref:Purine nucleoside phosphorylase n=1 Tax=Litorilituus sediminis TaxID=718192 RepID=A0A4P6P2E3_9GAMM|nr:peptidoglycan editing factor PgeF [Litorilituus sediminis]QBG35333.1 peptidoglycan editing factor PgeF [Litorilituus sediminis]
MPNKSINQGNHQTSCSAIEQAIFPANNILAIQTTRISPSDTLNKDNDFQSFNLALHVNDNADDVIKNREILARYIAKETSAIRLDIQWLEQVHGNSVVEVNEFSSSPLVADASITKQKHLALAIMTADCLPILLAHKEGLEVAAIHGGWRPLAGNIIANTITAMSSPVTEIVAWLGPCIGEKVFEVGQDVYDEFVQQAEVFQQAFTVIGNNKYLASLHQIAKLQLQALGVHSIESLHECTFSMPQKYYSYRKQAITGRMATVICRI